MHCSIETYNSAIIFTTSLSLLNMFKFKIKKKKPMWKYPDYRNLTRPEPPILYQTLSYQQTQSISESYNRKVYEQISND